MKRFITLVLFAVFGALAVSQSVNAVSSDPNHFISGDNTFYAYVKAGEKLSASFIRTEYEHPQALYPKAEDITVTIDGPDVKQQKCILKKSVAIGQGCTFAARTATKTGVWRVQVSAPDTAVTFKEGADDIHWGKYFFRWNITVMGKDGEAQGRLWTDRYAFRQPPGGEFVGDFTTFYMSEDGYIYRADNYDYDGQVSILSADAVGIRTGDECVSAYRSVSVDDEEYSPALGDCGSQYKLFFEEPAGNLPTEAERWDGEKEWVRPTIQRPTINELHFVPDDTNDQLSGDVTFYLRNFIGQYQVKIDVDNDGSFDGQDDVVLFEQMRELSNGLQRVHFQGVDKKGQIIFPSQTIGIKVEITKVAEIHFTAVDVEGRGGLELTRLNGEGAPTSRICWDDAQLPIITNKSLMTPEVDGRDCPDSSDGVHGWAYGRLSWGDRRYIDDWTYANAQLDGQNTIIYPEADEEEVAESTQNLVPIVIGSIAVMLLTVGGVVFAVVARRRTKGQGSDSKLPPSDTGSNSNPPSVPPQQMG